MDGAIGTRWIPLLLLLGILEARSSPRSINYAPVLWSIVFPLGMHAVATPRLSLASQVPPLRLLSEAMAWIALAAWVITSAGLTVTSAQRASASPSSIAGCEVFGRLPSRGGFTSKYINLHQ